MTDILVKKSGLVWNQVSDILLDRALKFPEDYEIIDEPTEGIKEPQKVPDAPNAPDGDQKPKETPQKQQEGGSEIDALRKEAESLGLEFNGNTSKAKLREMIEDKKASLK